MNYEGFAVVFNNETREETTLKLQGEMPMITKDLTALENDKGFVIRLFSIWQKRNYN